MATQWQYFCEHLDNSQDGDGDDGQLIITGGHLNIIPLVLRFNILTGEEYDESGHVDRGLKFEIIYDNVVFLAISSLHCFKSDNNKYFSSDAFPFLVV